MPPAKPRSSKKTAKSRRPVDSREKKKNAKQDLGHAILDLLVDEARAMHAAEITTQLIENGASLRPKDERKVSETLEKLSFDGLVIPRPGRRFRIAAEARIASDDVDGAFSANPRGFGFVRGGATGDDVYIPPDAIAGAMHGDLVRARVLATSSRGREGEVLEVLERRTKRVVGILRGREGQRRLEPDDGRARGPIPIVGERLDDEPLARLAKPREGVAAVVEIDQYPEDARELPNGVLVGVLGEPGDPDVEIAKVLLSHGIAEIQPPKAVTQARRYGDAPSDDELARRLDLLHIPFVAIDPSDARDHDDAVWVERDEHGNYMAWIAIADVSHYVTPDTPLDDSALARGCSVYLPDRAIPMVPPELSTHLCSLVENEVRLSMCVQVELDATGTVTRVDVHEAKVRVRAFFPYEAAARALGFTVDASRDSRAEAIRDNLQIMWDLACLLRERRMRRGAMDLDVPEARVVIDDESRAPVAVVQRGGDPGVKKAYRLIEEMMLLANESVAELMIKRGLPTIFRVHGAPDPEKLERLGLAMDALGVEFDPDDLTEPKKLTRFLRSVNDHDKKGVIHGLLLRTMQQASYDVKNIGHFGLASEAYLHFTSPIRRYPDLVVHRLLRASLRGQKPKPRKRKKGAEDEPSAEEKVRLAAVRASELERNAMEVEREIADVYRSLYMQRHIGDRFEGVVTGISHGGVWVRIRDPFVDVLIPNDRLGPDSYEADEAGIKIVGARSGDSVSLGNDIMLEIEDVSLVRRVTLAKRLAAPSKERRPTRKEKKDARRKGDKAKDKRKGRKGDKKTRSRSTSKSSKKKQKKNRKRR